MRDFEMHGRGHGRGFGRHRMGKGLIIGAVIFIVLGLLVMSLWNALLPTILGVNAIGFWQALGILVLSRILSPSVRIVVTPIENTNDKMGTDRETNFTRT